MILPYPCEVCLAIPLFKVREIFKKQVETTTPPPPLPSHSVQKSFPREWLIAYYFCEEMLYIVSFRSLNKTYNDKTNKHTINYHLGTMKYMSAIPMSARSAKLVYSIVQY